MFACLFDPCRAFIHIRIASFEHQLTIHIKQRQHVRSLRFKQGSHLTVLCKCKRLLGQIVAFDFNAMASYLRQHSGDAWQDRIDLWTTNAG